MANEHTELVRGLPPHEAKAVLALGTPRTISPGSVVFNLGDPADELYLITRGRLALTLPMQIHGRSEHVLVEERLAGETVGWSALIPPYRFTLNASAALETELLSFSRRALLAHFTARPQVGYVVIGNVATVIGHRLQVFQAMWVRQMQQMVDLKSP